MASCGICKSWLYAKKLSKVLWAKGMTCATYVIKTFSLINVKSPFELMSEEKSRIKHFKVFGSPCYVHVLASQKSKFDAKARKYCPSTMMIEERRF